MGKGEARNMCFTLNNYTPKELQLIEEAVTNTCIQYICWAFEVGESGTPHLQGYVQCTKPMTHVALRKATGLKRLKPDDAHGSDQDNVDYCKKGDQPHEEWKRFKTQGITYGLNCQFMERGERKTQGRRTDCHGSVNKVKAGEPLAEMMDTNYQAARHAELCCKYLEPARDDKPEVWWISGEMGAGKGQRLAELLSEHSARTYTKRTEDKWWDGYDRHENLVLRSIESPQKLNLRVLLGSGPMRVETKGASRQMVAERVFIVHEKPARFVEGMDQRILKKIDHHVHVRKARVPESTEVEGNIGPRLNKKGRWSTALGYKNQ